MRNQRKLAKFPRLILILALLRVAAVAQLDSTCTVSILNRNTTVANDGSWVLLDVPGGGPARARAVCTSNGLVRQGQSDILDLSNNFVTNVPPIMLGAAFVPIPSAIQVSASNSTIGSIGGSSRLTVTASFSDNTTRNITAASAGTVYRVSNPAIATVSADGVVTAVSSGTVIVQVTNEGAYGFTSIQVQAGAVDSDGDGIPDAIELQNGLNPHDPTDALLDADNDGLSNLEEYRLGTNIRNPDTDGDGIPDLIEVRLGLNPTVPDPTTTL